MIDLCCCWKTWFSWICCLKFFFFFLMLEDSDWVFCFCGLISENFRLQCRCSCEMAWNVMSEFCCLFSPTWFYFRLQLQLYVNVSVQPWINFLLLRCWYIQEMILGLCRSAFQLLLLLEELQITICSFLFVIDFEIVQMLASVLGFGCLSICILIDKKMMN